VTLAPLTIAPEGSDTRPLMPPLPAWASATEPVQRKRRQTERRFQTPLTAAFPLCMERLLNPGPRGLKQWQNPVIKTYQYCVRSDCGVKRKHQAFMVKPSTLRCRKVVSGEFTAGLRHETLSSSPERAPESRSVGARPVGELPPVSFWLYTGARVESLTVSSGAILRCTAGKSRFSTMALIPSRTIPVAIAPMASIG